MLSDRSRRWSMFGWFGSKKSEEKEPEEPRKKLTEAEMAAEYRAKFAHLLPAQIEIAKREFAEALSKEGSTGAILTVIARSVSTQGTCTTCDPNNALATVNGMRHCFHPEINKEVHTLITGEAGLMKKLRRLAKRRAKGQENGKKYQMLLDHFLRSAKNASWLSEK